MGFPTEIFVAQPVEDHLLCPICHDVFDDPSSFAGCGHSFCTDCLQQYECAIIASSRGRQCPTCRHTTNAISHSKNVSLNHVLQELQVKCNASHDGERAEDGDNRRVRRRLENGEAVAVPRSDITSCCGWTGKLQDWTKHQEVCPFVVEKKCPYCHWYGKQGLLNQHLLDNMDGHIMTMCDKRVKEVEDKLEVKIRKLRNKLALTRQNSHNSCCLS